MPRASTLRSYLVEFVVVFVGVALAFAVDNLREAHNDRTVGDQYLSAFRQDLTAHLQMLQDQQDARQAQLRNARTLVGDRRIETGLRLIVANLDFDDGSLLPLLERAKSQVEQLLQQIPAR